jgi:hypothetical protein
VEILRLPLLVGLAAVVEEGIDGVVLLYGTSWHWYSKVAMSML